MPMRNNKSEKCMRYLYPLFSVELEKTFLHVKS